MISCYFILLMNIHKKQNGQLARPFIAQVWLFLFRECRPQSTAGWPSEVPAPHPFPCAPCHTGFDSCYVWSASLLLSQPDTPSLFLS